MTSSDFSTETYGPYQAQDVLGTSSIGTVYRAVHRYTGETVALRVLTPAANPEQLDRFLEELRQLSWLENPYIVPIQAYGVEDNSVYVAMPLLMGGTLHRRLEEQAVGDRPLPSVGEVIWLLRRLAEALDYIHFEGVTHHQVAPRNILFDDDGNVFLADTGVAKLFKVAFSLKASNSFSSYQFASPEQWQGDNITPASDQYSLAAVIYRVLTGKDLFEAPTIAGLMDKHLHAMFTPPHYVRVGVPAQLVIPLAKALAKPPGDRYSTVTEFAETFAQMLQGLEGQETGFFL